MVEIPIEARNSRSYVLSAPNRIDFSYLEMPKVFEAVDFEAMLAEAISTVEDKERAAGREPGQIYESHTFAKLLEAAVHLKELLHHRVNEAAEAVLVSHSTGTDLEALGAFFGVTRQLLEPLPLDPSKEPRFENDTDLRRRIALAPERLSLAATLSSYVFFALSANDKPTRVDVEKASPQEVLVRYTFDQSYAAASIVDASAHSPAPGKVVVTLMDRSESGVPPVETVRELHARMNQPWAKPLTDDVSVRAVETVQFDIEATLSTYPGVDRAKLLSDARARLDEFLKRQRRIGRDITVDGIKGALMGPNIHSILMPSPATDIIVSRTQVALVGRISLHLGDLNV